MYGAYYAIPIHEGRNAGQTTLLILELNRCTIGKWLQESICLTLIPCGSGKKYKNCCGKKA